MPSHVAQNFLLVQLHRFLDLSTGRLGVGRVERLHNLAGNSHIRNCQALCHRLVNVIVGTIALAAQVI